MCLLIWAQSWPFGLLLSSRVLLGCPLALVPWIGSVIAFGHRDIWSVTGVCMGGLLLLVVILQKFGFTLIVLWELNNCNLQLILKRFMGKERQTKRKFFTSFYHGLENITKQTDTFCLRSWNVEKHDHLCQLARHLIMMLTSDRLTLSSSIWPLSKADTNRITQASRSRRALSIQCAAGTGDNHQHHVSCQMV